MFIASVILLSIWEIYWTAKACWKAAQAKEGYWFIFMLVFNLWDYRKSIICILEKIKMH